MQIRRVKKLTEINQDIRKLTISIGGVNLSPKELVAQKKLFLADYSFLDSIPLHRNFVFYSPQVLFFLNREGNLELFAIHLRTNKGQQSHVMTKKSSPNKFLFAKMHALVADAQSHEFAYHLRVHLMVESFAIARNNYLRKLR